VKSPKEKALATISTWRAYQNLLTQEEEFICR